MPLPRPEAPVEPPPASRAVAPSFLPVGECFAERLGQSRRIFRWNQPAGDSIRHDFRDTTHGTGDDRHSLLHRLEDDERHPFVGRRHDEGAAVPQQLPHAGGVRSTVEIDGLANIEPLDRTLERPAMLTVAHHHQTRLRTAVTEPAQGVEQDLDPLAYAQPADEQEIACVGRSQRRRVRLGHRSLDVGERRRLLRAVVTANLGSGSLARREDSIDAPRGQASEEDLKRGLPPEEAPLGGARPTEHPTVVP